jgi:oligoribonuclease NrnB/cAMP/cGMP phosphodiesterase (DHH superfamily)
MRVKLFTHTDLDGIGCAVLGKLAFKNIDISYVDYNNVNDIVLEFINNKEYDNYDHIYITDISINEDVSKIIHNTNPLNEMFTILDHHPTAEWLNKYWWAKVNVIENELQEKTSGTYMFYKELVALGFLEKSESIRIFTDTVRKYDTWLWKEKYNDDFPKKLNDLFYILGRERFLINIENKIKNDGVLLNSDDLLLLELEQEKIDRYIESKNKNLLKRQINGYLAGVVFAEQFHSELGNRLCELNPDIDFVVIVNIDKSVSYRGIKNDIDLGKDVAKFYGGGGHPKASGSPINDEIRSRLLDLIFSR